LYYLFFSARSRETRPTTALEIIIIGEIIIDRRHYNIIFYYLHHRRRRRRNNKNIMFDKYIYLKQRSYTAILNIIRKLARYLSRCAPVRFETIVVFKLPFSASSHMSCTRRVHGLPIRSPCRRCMYNI